MKRVSAIIKEASEARIKEYLKESSAVFIVKYSGISSLGMSMLRKGLRNANARLFVVKNTVARRAFSTLGTDSLLKHVDGLCGIVFIKNEPVDASKVLFNFAKENEKLKFEAGLFGDKLLNKEDIEMLARLPSKDILRAQVVGALNSPISGLVFTLNQLISKFVYCLDQVRQKKSS